MLGRQLLRQVRIIRLDGLHNTVMLFVRSDGAIRRGERPAADSHDILMVVLQQMLQHLGGSGRIQNPMKLIVQLRHLLHIALLRVELREINVLLHLVHLFLGNVLAGPAGTQPLQTCTNHINVTYILRLDSGNKSSAVRNDLNKALQLQLTKCLPDRRAGYPELLTDRNLLQLLIFLIFPVQNVVTDLMKNSSPQRILITHVPFHIVIIHFPFLCSSDLSVDANFLFYPISRNPSAKDALSCKHGQ